MVNNNMSTDPYLKLIIRSVTIVTRYRPYGYPEHQRRYKCVATIVTDLIKIRGWTYSFTPEFWSWFLLNNKEIISSHYNFILR